MRVSIENAKDIIEVAILLEQFDRMSDDGIRITSAIA
jgi:hypothetical protein